MTLTRRAAIGFGFALPAIARAAAPTVLRAANIMPADHPLNTRLAAAGDEIARRTEGRVRLAIFPASQLGTDAAMLDQLRTGAIQIFAQSGLILASLAPEAALSGVGFAFRDYGQVWQAMDGPVGQGIAQALDKAGLAPVGRVWDNGFRQTTTSGKPLRAVGDIDALRIRVPPSQLWTSLFRTLGAAPVSIPWGETYSALQTHVADGVENPLAGLYFAKMYEVQKYLSRTDHMWDGFWVVANPRALDALSAADRATVVDAIDAQVPAQRADVARLNDQLAATLQSKGLGFVTVDRDSFRQRLQRSGFYAEWKQRFGDAAWARLESVTGRLA